MALAGLNIVADRRFKKRGTEVKPFKRPSALVTDGVFVDRGGVLEILLDRLFIIREEEMVEETFGAAYLASARGCGHLEWQARQGELAGRGTG